MTTATTNDSTAAAAVQDLVITRYFDAPRMRVWKAWTEPEHCMRWWGPKNFTSPFCRIDLRPLGAYLNCMRSPEGLDYWSTGIYRVVEAPSLLICTDNFADENGNVVPASHYGMVGDWSQELLITVTFTEQDGGTLLTLRHTGLPMGEMSDLTTTGWNESFDKLAEFLTKTKNLL